VLSHDLRHLPPWLTFDVRQKKTMMKYILSLLLIVAVICRAEENDFSLNGVVYRSTLTADDTKGTPGWKPGDGEPAVLPNKAFELARAEFQKEFGAHFPKVDTYIINLRYVSGGSTNLAFWEIVFTEVLAPEDYAKRPRKALPDGGQVIEIANLKYFVFFDGKIIGPRPVEYFENWLKNQK
jgi:hypothetical protein